MSRIKFLLFILFFTYINFSCTNVKEAKRIGTLFYEYLKSGDYTSVSSLIDFKLSKSNFTEWQKTFEKLNKRYGKILSYSVKNVEIKPLKEYDDGRPSGEFVAELVYKVKYEKATVKERLVMVSTFDDVNNIRTFVIVAYQSGVK